MDQPYVAEMFKRFFEAGPQVDTSTWANTTSTEARRAAGEADFMLVTCIDYRYATSSTISCGGNTR